MQCEKWGVKEEECQGNCGLHRECLAWEYAKIESQHGYTRCTLVLTPVKAVRRMDGYKCKAKQMIEHVPISVPSRPKVERPEWTGSCNGHAVVPPLNPPATYFRQTKCELLVGPNTDFGASGCTDLAYTDLRGKNLQGAKLEGVDLCGAHLDYANLRLAEISGSKAEGASFRNAAMEGAKFEGSEFQFADLSNTDLRGLDLKNSRGEFTVFSNAMMNYADLSDSKLEGAVFHGTSLAGASIEYAEVTNADFTGASGLIALDKQGIAGIPIGLTPRPVTGTTATWGGPNFVAPSWGTAPAAG